MDGESHARFTATASRPTARFGVLLSTKKKLGLTQMDAELDAANRGVGEAMKTSKAKNRETVYSLLAERFGKALDLRLSQPHGAPNLNPPRVKRDAVGVGPCEPASVLT